MPRLFLGLFWLVVIQLPVLAQSKPATANDAYEYLQNQRQRAEEVVGTSRTPSPDSLSKAERILQDALTYYHRPDVLKLAQNNQPLYYRKSDILFDLATLQAQQGKIDAAVASMTFPLSTKYAPAYLNLMRRNKAFEAVLRNPAIVAKTKELRAIDNIFNSQALATSYQPNLSESEKVAGLSKLWSEAKYNFAYFDHIPDVDWDKLYLDYIPKVQATSSTLAYFYVLKEFYAQLRDGHTDVWTNSGPLVDSAYARPPLRCMLVEGRVFVQQVRHDSLERSGITPGLEILQIDGQPVVEFANRYVRPYQSGSTPQNVDVQTYTYNLLRGPSTRPVAVTFRDRTGKTFTRRLLRSSSVLKPDESVTLRFLPGNVALLQVNEFESDKGFQRFKAAFDSIANTNALIIDLRRNGGGNSNNGFSILSYLTNKPFRTGQYQSRIYSPVRRARGEGVMFEAVDTGSMVAPNRAGKLYAKPVAVLIGGMTFSAAEDFCSAYVGMKRGALIGEPTGGSTGQPLVFSLPGGLMARVCTKRDAYPDGTEWNGRGIQPTILVSPTAADLQNGRDSVLEAALRYLQTGSGALETKR